MKSKAINSIESLVKHIEAIFLRETHFFVSFTRTQMDPVKLLSLKLLEVRRPQPNDVGLTLLLDGKFEGRHGPHKFVAKPETLAECGISALTVGMGAAPNTNGTVVKGMRVQFCPSFLNEAIVAEVKAMFRAVAPATHLTTLKPVKDTKRYKEVALEISEIDQEINKLTKARAQAKAKLERMCAKASLQAEASKLLPVKNISRSRPYAV